MAEPSPKSTPKRKRGEDTILTPIKFSFDLSRADSSEDGSGSPRSNVAHRFRGLELGSGGGVATDEAGVDADALEAVRKRQRPDEVMHDAPEPVGVTGVDGKTVPEPAVATEEKATAEGSIQKSYPSINRLSDSKSRVMKRAGTPPLRLNKGHRVHENDDGEDDEHYMDIVDPVRAALTWHEDEITVYDPDDEDDDGTGINGIGFKPTPALAHARTMKRRQQMAEYRKREESEARAKRSQRRRGGATLTVGPDDKSPERKVRFMDGERQNIAITTG